MRSQEREIVSRHRAPNCLVANNSPHTRAALVAQGTTLKRVALSHQNEHTPAGGRQVPEAPSAISHRPRREPRFRFADGPRGSFGNRRTAAGRRTAKTRKHGRTIESTRSDNHPTAKMVPRPDSSEPAGPVKTGFFATAEPTEAERRCRAKMETGDW